MREAFYQEDFDAIQKDFDNFKWYLAMSEPLPEDNWTGLTGFIHQVLYDEYLKDHPAPEDIEYYLVRPAADAQGLSGDARQSGCRAREHHVRRFRLETHVPFLLLPEKEGLRRGLVHQSIDGLLAERPRADLQRLLIVQNRRYICVKDVVSALA